MEVILFGFQNQCLSKNHFRTVGNRNTSLRFPAFFDSSLNRFAKLFSRAFFSYHVLYFHCIDLYSCLQQQISVRPITPTGALPAQLPICNCNNPGKIPILTIGHVNFCSRSVIPLQSKLLNSLHELLLEKSLIGNNHSLSFK